jgi:hypothetical protein
MKDAQKPDHVSLNTLVNYLRDGRFVIPDFQREFEWKPWDIRELMRSVFLDYYIGSLLLWKGKQENFAALSCEPVYGYQGSGRAEYIVLASLFSRTLAQRRVNQSVTEGFIVFLRHVLVDVGRNTKSGLTGSAAERRGARKA